MKSNYSKLGNYITESKIKNKNSSETNLVGLSNEKRFTKSKANIIGADLSRYKLIAHNQFVYMPTTSRNGDKISVAVFKEKSGMISSSYTVFSVDSNLLNPDYLMLWFERPEFDRYARYHSHGSVREIFSWEDMQNIELFVPPLDYQNKIVQIKNIIDNRISILQEINKNLEEQLKAIFYKWFESKINEELPNNWDVEKLQEVASFSQGVQIPIEEQKKEAEDGYTRFIRIIDITQRNEKDIRFIEDRDRGHVSENEIFMIRYGTPGILSRNYEGIIANNLFKISPLKKVTSNYLFSALNVDRIQEFIKGNATSSTMPAISFSTLNNQEIIIPDKEIMKKFDEISEYVRLKQLNILKETKKLSQFRDILLPKLLFGEIDISKIKL